MIPFPCEYENSCGSEKQLNSKIMKYQLTVWDASVAYTIVEIFWSEQSAVDWARSRSHAGNNVRLYSCEKRADIYSHYSS